MKILKKASGTVKLLVNRLQSKEVIDQDEHEEAMVTISFFPSFVFTLDHPLYTRFPGWPVLNAYCLNVFCIMLVILKKYD